MKLLNRDSVVQQLRGELYPRVLADKVGPVTPIISDVTEKLERKERKIAVLYETMGELEMCAIKQHSTPIIAILDSMETLNRVTVKILLRQNGMDPRMCDQNYIHTS